MKTECIITLKRISISFLKFVYTVPELFLETVLMNAAITGKLSQEEHALFLSGNYD